MGLPSGTRFGPYEVLSLIGAGGMGEVYRARDTRLDRQVAVKVLAPELANDPEFRARFANEAKTISALSHPHICRLYDIGREHDTEYLVLELIEGETLAVRLEQGPLPLARAVAFAVEISDALDAAHRQGITHRDLKPANILLTAAGTKLLDFGLAIRLHEQTIDEITRPSDGLIDAGTIAGTLPYMAPELLQGVKGDERSDIWALGVLLHEMVAGERPFTGRTAFEVSSAILREPPGPLPACVPATLVRIIRKCLAKDPAERYQRPGEVRAALETGASADPVGEVRELPAPPRMPPRMLAWTSMATALLALGVVALMRPGLWSGWRSSALGDPTSLAILPLVNGTGDHQTEYLSDGISDALINSLSQVPQLRVMARGTVFSYKGKEVDPRKVGQELDVQAVFSGRLTQHDDATIVQAELANASDGTQIWGERYTRVQADLPALQEAIAVDILEQLRLELTPGQQRRITKRITDNPAAYRLFLQGRYHSNRLTTEGMKRGIELMNQAISLDPTYALAYAGLADAYADASGVYLPASEALPRARAAAEHALRLDATLAEPHAVLGYIRGTHDWRWAEAEQELRRTIALRPSYARAHEAYSAILMIRGRAEEAIAAMTRARTLDPLSDLIRVAVGWYYYLARRYPEALTLTQRIVEVDPNLIAAHYNLGMIYSQTGRHQEALAAFEKARALDPTNWPVLALLCHGHVTSGDRARAQQLLVELTARASEGSLDPTWIGLIHAALGDTDRAFLWLEKAYHARSETLLFLNVDPKYDSLRSDPRFGALVKRLNLEGRDPTRRAAAVHESDRRRLSAQPSVAMLLGPGSCTQPVLDCRVLR
jgi:serine/threonine protein kinase/tetratricopeptide (TPR) repeat protein